MSRLRSSIRLRGLHGLLGKKAVALLARHLWFYCLDFNDKAVSCKN